MKRVLPAAIYDALRVSAEKYGGVGAGAYSLIDHLEGRVVPFCIHGHAMAVVVPMNVVQTPAQALHDLGITTMRNDIAVRAANRDQWPRSVEAWFGHDTNDRITWAQWCEAMHVVRGTDEDAWLGAYCVEDGGTLDDEYVGVTIDEDDTG